MTTVYFVRHAQPVHLWPDNRTRPLTEEGKRDCAMVTEFFRKLPVDGFYCSPYERSLATIAGVAQVHGMKITEDARLRERDAAPGGNTRELIARRWADLSFHEPGGESLAMVEKRNLQALWEILSENENKTLVIGTHGTALSTILHYYDPSFGVEDFFRVIDWMPWILKLDFEGRKLQKVTQCGHIEKPFMERA